MLQKEQFSFKGDAVVHSRLAPELANELRPLHIESLPIPQSILSNVQPGMYEEKEEAMHVG